MNNILTPACKTVLDTIHEHGHEAYLVGGCVRDYFLSRPIKDVDITTSASPDEILEMFEDYTIFTFGMKHGTVCVIIDDESFEITTYRKDGEYLNSRHPESVDFSDNLSEDLKRRDFTINAMAWNETTGFIDLFHGIEDILTQRISCVGEPEIRFQEDALRILRAVRFASTLNFTVEPKTKEAMLSNCKNLSEISRERVYKEFIGCICGENVKNVLMDFAPIFEVFIPEIAVMKGFEQNSKYHIYDVLEHTCVAMEKIVPTPTMRLAAFFHDIGKPFAYTENSENVGHFKGHELISAQIAEDTLLALKCPKKTIKDVVTLVTYHDCTVSSNRISVKTWMRKIPPPIFFDLIELKKADTLAKNPRYSDKIFELNKIIAVAHDIIEKHECYCLKQLHIGGKDLIKIGIPQDEAIDKMLSTLLTKVIEGKLVNDKATLVKRARYLHKNPTTKPRNSSKNKKKPPIKT